MRHSKRHCLAAALACLAMFQVVAGPLHAEPTQPATVPASQPVTPVMKGQPAPFTGLLVPEARFVQDLRMRIDQDGLKYKLKLTEQHHADDAKIWRDNLASCQQDLNKAADTPWYKSPKTWFIVGTVVGLAAGIFTVYGASKLVNK